MAKMVVTEMVDSFVISGIAISVDPGEGGMGPIFTGAMYIWPPRYCCGKSFDDIVFP